MVRPDDWPTVREWYAETVAAPPINGEDFEALSVDEKVKWAQMWEKLFRPPATPVKVEWVRFKDEPPYNENGVFFGLMRTCDGPPVFRRMDREDPMSDHPFHWWLRNMPRLPQPWADSLELHLKNETQT